MLKQSLAMVLGVTLLAAGRADEGTDGRGAVPDAALYDVGIARIEVTPEYPIRLNGFGNRRAESEGVGQPIWAKALAISRGDDPPAVLVTLDSLGVRLTMVDEVASRLRDKAGLPRDRFVLCFSHSHCTPKVNGASDNIFSSPIPPEHQRHIDQYTTELADKIEQVALAALQRRTPARLSWSVGTVTFAKNRRLAGGPVDHDLPVLFVRSPDGDMRAVHVGYACHCVTLGYNKISGDWAGYAQALIERKFPGAVAMVAIGAGSDSNPRSDVTGDKVDVAEAQGAEIADEVARLADGATRALGGPLTTTLERITLPLHPPPSREKLQEMTASPTPAGYNAQTQLARLDRGEPLVTEIHYPVQTWSFGDSLSIVFLAGEVCVDYSHRLKRELDRTRLWVTAYSNDFCAYIPSERLLREGGYGGGAEIPYFALPTTFRPGLEQKIVDQVKGQVPLSFHVGAGTQGVPPPTPEQSRSAIRVRDGLRVELAAAEPLVADPVAIDFGPDGRVWVAEMIDYARGAEEEFTPHGRVKVIEDSDGDGRLDRGTVFTEGLRFPTDVKVWRGGLIVCDAPDILWLEDTDGDGQADTRKKLYTGFETHNAQARVNSLQWGLDNWLYGSGGLFGGHIVSASGQTADVSGRDFRIRPDTGEIEPVTGRTQQSRVRDDWDNWFGCTNGALLLHYPVSDQYARRNPHIAPPSPQVHVPNYEGSEQLFPIGELVRFTLSGPAGRPTSACGLGIYRDEWLGAEFAGDSFTCEPVNQLVHRLQLSRQGTTFSGKRPPDERDAEFLASTDRWFRPVQARTGPDGALWVVDMCRYVIEHPRWIPVETLATLDVMAGQGLGRLYRVLPAHGEARKVPRLDRLKGEELAAALDTPNGTQRDLVHQLIIWRQDRAGTPTLQRLARESPDPRVRVQALGVLDGLGALDDDLVTRALRDSHLEVRRHAVRLAEPRLDASPAVLKEVLKRADDDAPPVQLQLAYSLGASHAGTAATTLGELAVRFAGDPYLSSAVLSSLQSENVRVVLERVLAAQASNKGLPDELVDGVLRTAAELGDERATAGILATILQSGRPTNSAAPRPPADQAERNQASRYRAVARVLETAERRQITLGLSLDGAARSNLETLLRQARAVTDDVEKSDAARIAAITLLARSGSTSDDADRARTARDAELDRLGRLLAPRNSNALQNAALQLLAESGADVVPELLIAAWNSASPSVRGTMLDTLLARDAWQAGLLDALEAGKIAPGDVDASRRGRLLAHRDEQVRTRAAKVLVVTADDRRKAIERYRPAANQAGHAESGKAVFAKVCANCHKLEEKGQQVGPDLAGLTNRSTEFLLAAILDPSQDVDARYMNYVAVRGDGRTVTGLLSDETSTSVTIVEQADKRHVILRRELEELRGTGKSMMPEGLEKDLSTDDMANLLAYLATVGPRPKSFPGNEPIVVVPDERGRITLAAKTAEIHGGDIIFEGRFANIGYWHGERDHVRWRVRSATPARLDVHLDWACAVESSGNGFRFEGAHPLLRGRVESTGGWDTYRQTRIGTISLEAGEHVFTLRPDGKMTRAALMDLRAVYLVPEGADPARPTEPARAPSNPLQPAAIARLLLDDGEPQDRREKLIADNPRLASRLIREMTADLPADAKEEYRRIPWIWRVAIAAGKRNEPESIVEILRESLPADGQRLRDWQAVVIGGGLINGISQAGPWPATRIERLLEGQDQLRARWRRSLTLSAEMADNEKTPMGTRYDALRMIALEGWDRRGEQLAKYLGKEINAELQMGAVSGLADIESPRATRALLDNWDHYVPRNRELALDALLRSTDRVAALLDAVQAGRVKRESLGDERMRKLIEHADDKLRSRAREVLK